MCFRRWSNRSLWWVVQIAGGLLATYLWIVSDGAILHDEIGHFLISRNSWRYPELILDVWGRVGTTLTYMVPALGGWELARAASFGIALLTAAVATRVAREIGVRSLYLVPLFLWAQPWFSEASFTVVTEVPFSLLLVWGAYTAMRGRHLTASMAFGILPLVRHEGLLITLLWSVGTVATRRWGAGLVAWLPFVGYNLVHYAAIGSWPFEVMLEPSPSTFYGSGGWFHFVPRVVVNAGLPVAILALLGARRLLALRPAFVWAYVTYLGTHVVLYRFGLFASAGYSIFLLPLAPALAVAATLGIEEIRAMLDRFGILQHRWRQVLTAIVLVAIVNAALTVTPHSLGDEGVAVQDAATWLRDSGTEHDQVWSSHVWFYHFADLNWTPQRMWSTPIDLEAAPSGTLLVWDSRYAPRMGAPYEALESSSDDWETLWASENQAAVVFRRR